MCGGGSAQQVECGARVAFGLMAGLCDSWAQVADGLDPDHPKKAAAALKEAAGGRGGGGLRGMPLIFQNSLRQFGRHRAELFSQRKLAGDASADLMYRRAVPGLPTAQLLHAVQPDAKLIAVSQWWAGRRAGRRRRPHWKGRRAGGGVDGAKRDACVTAEQPAPRVRCSATPSTAPIATFVFSSTAARATACTTAPSASAPSGGRVRTRPTSATPRAASTRFAAGSGRGGVPSTRRGALLSHV